MRLKRTIILILFALLLSVCVNAQTVIILDKSTREPLANVVISGKGNVTVTTNIIGKADISMLDKNSDIITLHPLYNPHILSELEKTQTHLELNLTARVVTLDEVVLSANRNTERKIDIPYTINIIHQKEIEFGNQPTTGDVLQNTGAVFVQKSQLGGGSPVLRGFEANRVLLVVDGVRMNNAIYRGGHLQDIITLDPNMLERTEVLFGPSSTIYGSDALGGVIHLYTKNALFSTTDKMFVKTNAMLRYASVNNENTAHIDLNLGWKKFAALTNITHARFGDMMSGTNRLAQSPGRWNRTHYSERFGNRDSMVVNPNPDLQIGSSYTQTDFMQRFNYMQSLHRVHGINLQYSESSHIPRYDRLTEYSGKLLRFAEWNYGPQKRRLASYVFSNNSKTNLSDDFKIIAAYQKINQDRISRRFQNNKRSTQMEDVTVLSFNTDVMKTIKEKHEVRYGAEMQANKVKSTAHTLNIVTGSVSPAATRYADGGNKMNIYGIYISHAFEVNQNFVISDGLRFTASTLQSDFGDTTFYKFPFKTVKQNSRALTGNLGFTWKEENNYKMSLLVNSGFRTPNVDDMAKVFESTGNILIVPNENIQPEYASNFELGFSKVVGKSYKFDVTLFYTNIEKILVLADHTYKGEDSVAINGVKRKVQAMQNKNRGYIYGFSAGTQFDLNKNVALKTIINYTYGRYYDAKKDTVQPLDHIPPLFGQLALLFKEKNLDAEFFVRFNGKKNSSDYSTSGEDNAQYSANPVEGYMPGWFTLNIRAGYNLTKQFRTNIAFENISDNRYRVFASGINAPGKNFIVSVRYKF